MFLVSYANSSKKKFCTDCAGKKINFVILTYNEVNYYYYFADDLLSWLFLLLSVI